MMSTNSIHSNASNTTKPSMTVDNALHVIAGTFIMLSVALGHFVNPWWFAFTFFVGANLFQSGITKWCLMATILRKLGMKDCCDSSS